MNLSLIVDQIPSYPFTRQLTGLFDPIGKLAFIKLISLVNIKIADFFLLGLAWREWLQ